MKRILTIQDISCVGKCSLTVALPIISAFGVETSVLPTAVLSTHTAFKDFTFRDLTCDMQGIAKHWKEQNISFDALYTGYLGSFEQLNIVSNLIDNFKTKDNFVIIDPVMGDNGSLYVGFDQAFANSMAKLCSKADIIVPNLTEASFMLKEPYIEKDYDEDYITQTLKKLTNLGAKKAVLTGVKLGNNQIGAYAYDSTTNSYFSYFREYLPESFHGTGDVFASTLCGGLTIKKTLYDALKIAVDYTVESIKITINSPDKNWYGVEFEKAIPYLIDRIK